MWRIALIWRVPVALALWIRWLITTGIPAYREECRRQREEGEA